MPIVLLVMTLATIAESPAPLGALYEEDLDFFIMVNGSFWDDKLQYDDGTAHWLTWDGLYRGTWFDTQDFMPGTPGFNCDNTEYWFYHHSSYPWDTSVFYAELWNGVPAAPIWEMDSRQVTALHYTAVYAEYTSPIWVDQHFWVIVNTELSSGGWPSLLADNTPQSTPHSFVSDDFIVWESWPRYPPAIQPETWGMIKGLFR